MRLYPYQLAVLPLAALLAGCGAPGVPAKAMVTLIDRKCEIIQTTRRDMVDGSGKTIERGPTEMKHRTGECKDVEEWQELRKKRTKDVNGTATVHVEYQAPQDGSYRQATLNFTGRDDEFYKLNAGDSIDILVAKDDPAKIRKA